VLLVKPDSGLRILPPRSEVLSGICHTVASARSRLGKRLQVIELAREAERLLADTGWLPEPFRMADAGDVLENANAYLYTGTAPFSLVTGGFLLGVYPLTKVAAGQYTVAFSDNAPSTGGTLYFEIRVQVATGLTPSFLDSPDPLGGSGPWSMAISLPGSQPCTPVAAFRDTNGSIRLISYGSTTVQFWAASWPGGSMAPSMANPAGRRWPGACGSGPGPFIWFISWWLRSHSCWRGVSPRGEAGHYSKKSGSNRHTSGPLVPHMATIHGNLQFLWQSYLSGE